jgi:hypothetical protein
MSSPNIHSPTYIDFQEENPAYGTKWGPIGNMLQNTLGTWWWTIKKSLYLHPSPILPRRTTGSIGCMLQLLIGWARFWSRPMAEYQSDLWGHSHTHTHVYTPGIRQHRQLTPSIHRQDYELFPRHLRLKSIDDDHKWQAKNIQVIND